MTCFVFSLNCFHIFFLQMLFIDATIKKYIYKEKKKANPRSSPCLCSFCSHATHLEVLGPSNEHQGRPLISQGVPDSYLIAFLALPYPAVGLGLQLRLCLLTPEPWHCCLNRVPCCNLEVDESPEQFLDYKNIQNYFCNHLCFLKSVWVASSVFSNLVPTSLALARF